MNYGPSEGYLPLRQWLSSHLGQLGVSLQSQDIQITSGGQQALDLVCRTLVSPGETVAVAQPTYLGALQIFRSQGANVVGVPLDDEGPIVSALEDVFAQKPKFFYTVTDFSNPTGESMSLLRRQQLIACARKYGIPIVDDAAYQQLRYRGDDMPPLMALDNNSSNNHVGEKYPDNLVIHVGTFSKTLAPGLRVGWIAAPRAFLDKVVIMKQAADLHSPMLNQMLVKQAADACYDDHVSSLRQHYGQKRDCMIDALQSVMPDDVQFTKPDGGMFVWLTLPEGFNAVDLMRKAIAEGNVAFIPGAPFFPNAEQGARYCRLSFSGPSKDDIVTGITSLAEVITRSRRANAMTVDYG